MPKKLLASVIAVLVVGVVALAAVGTVLAQEPTPTTTPPSKGRGLGSGLCSEAICELLGMTPAQILAERQAGKTLAQIAQEQGVSEQQLIDAIIAEQQALLDQAVKDGKLTQAQADWLLARAKALAPFQITNPFAPGQGGRWNRMGGGCRGYGRAPTTDQSAQ